MSGSYDDDGGLIIPSAVVMSTPMVVSGGVRSASRQRFSKVFLLAAEPPAGTAPAARSPARIQVPTRARTLLDLGWVVANTSHFPGAWKPEQTSLAKPPPALVPLQPAGLTLAAPTLRLPRAEESEPPSAPELPATPRPESRLVPIVEDKPTQLDLRVELPPDEPVAEVPSPEEDADDDAEAMQAFRAALVERGAPPELLKALDDVEKAPEPPPRTPPTPDELRAMFAQTGQPSPPALEELLGALDPAKVDPDDEDEALEAAPEPELPARERVLRAVAAGESCAGWELIEVDLSGLDLSRGRFEKAILRGANLRGAVLDDAVLDDAVLVGAAIDGATFRRASLARAELSEARGERASFEGAKLDDATMRAAVLPDAIFRGASGKRLDASQSELSRASFEGAVLDAADLSRCALEEAFFGRASLVDTSIEDANATDARFDESNFDELRAGGANLSGARMRKGSGEGARFPGARLVRASFSFSKLSRADFDDASMPMAVLEGCVLKNARFDRADLRDASFLAADLYQARFEGANLNGADLRGASLYGAELWDAILTGANLELADLSGTKLEQP